jgi:hypothetical protein
VSSIVRNSPRSGERKKLKAPAVVSNLVQVRIRKNNDVGGMCLDRRLMMINRVVVLFCVCKLVFRDSHQRASCMGMGSRR